MAETYDDLLEQYESFLNDDVSFAAGGRTLVSSSQSMKAFGSFYYFS
jgi:hypothetical protein